MAFPLISSASSPITQGAAPTSWRAFCATSAQRVRHRQSTTFAPGSAAGPSRSLVPPGDMAHVRRALANALYTRVLPNALTVFLNDLSARRMLSRHGECSHGTANTLTAPRKLPRTLPRMLPRTLPRGLPRVLPEHSPMLTELRHSSYPLKDRKAAPVPQKISNVGILNAAVRSVAGY
ncbi:hypothetical protein P167DRAFT_573999 [Morchella conica CCBAS932]|uniref:Uncharacterized protein n=1 Tax=Morchella conica CCBAS932 TaxID=1392247 RepID=A0A3N4KSZ5_9PEZI|nr:hypothetical protein P167DRAFT_573999 [Morchella conica CCBAS932]